MHEPIRSACLSTGSHRQRGRGQALVEFALVFPILIIIILGTVDLGRAVYAYNTVGNAARSGVRVAIVSQTAASIRNAAKAQAVLLDLQDSDIAVTYGCASPYSIDCVASVTVTYKYLPITPVISQIFSTITLSSTTHQPIEHVGP